MGHWLPSGLLGGLLVVALVTLMLGVTLGGVLYHRDVTRFVRRLAGRVSPPPEQPTRLPIERLAHDVRRVRAEVLTLPPSTPMAKRIGVLKAYDDLLVDACHALAVPDTLTAMPEGFERDAERLHVEHELDSAGLRLSA